MKKTVCLLAMSASMILCLFSCGLSAKTDNESNNADSEIYAGNTFQESSDEDLSREAASDGFCSCGEWRYDLYANPDAALSVRERARNIDTIINDRIDSAVTTVEISNAMQFGIEQWADEIKKFTGLLTSELDDEQGQKLASLQEQWQEYVDGLMKFDSDAFADNATEWQYMTRETRMRLYRDRAIWLMNEYYMAVGD